MRPEGQQGLLCKEQQGSYSRQMEQQLQSPRGRKGHGMAKAWKRGQWGYSLGI